jgi:hypothetical protein
MLSYPKLTYVAQVYTPDKVVLDAEAKATQILHAGPRHSPNNDLLISLNGF